MKKVALLLMALLADLRLGEPIESFHPVVWIGKAITLLEEAAPKEGPKERRVYGVAMLLAVVGLASLLPRLLGLLRGVLMPARLLGAIWLLKSTFALKALWDAADEVRYCLDNGNAFGAREGLRKLVSRDVRDLSEVQVAAAVVESVAENLNDSFVAPLFYYRVAGLPGAMWYRAANTLDAMVGYRSPEYEDLGKAAARFDDLLNFVPARLAGILVIIASLFTGDDPIGGAKSLIKYRRRTESPNAGWPMSAMAGALGVELEKPGHYRLGDGGALPSSDSIRKAVTVAGAAAGIALLGYVASELFIRGRKG